MVIKKKTKKKKKKRESNFVLVFTAAYMTLLYSRRSNLGMS